MSDHEDLLLKQSAVQQNRHWVRIASVCNNRCLFCLDSDSHDGTFIPDEIIRSNIENGFCPGKENRLILSGGEASIHPRLCEYIEYGKKIGYQWIQTVTNGNQFGDLEFCRRVFSAGLNEVTFSMHAHTEKLHDYLVGTPGAFKKSLHGIILIRKYFPDIVVNVDIVVNRANVSLLPDIVRFYMRLGIMEFDILQIIPFGRAFSEYRKELFYRPSDYAEALLETWKLSRIQGVHMWTNRFPAEALEGYEELIQDPKKVVGEVMGEWRANFEALVEQGGKPNCFGERCESCFNHGYCHGFLSGKTANLDALIGRVDIQDVTAVNGSNHPIKRYVSLRWSDDWREIHATFGKTPKDFIRRISEVPLWDSDELVNVPRCIRDDHNLGKYETHADMNLDGTLESYTQAYIKNLYRKKSLRCGRCKYASSCEGIGIHFIRAYGFSLLQPVLE